MIYENVLDLVGHTPVVKYENIYIKYDENDFLSFCSLGDFINMRATIDYYKSGGKKNKYIEEELLNK